jgi:hypothetical protein
MFYIYPAHLTAEAGALQAQAGFRASFGRQNEVGPEEHHILAANPSIAQYRANSGSATSL